MALIDLQATPPQDEAWRHDLQAHPEFGFEGHRTAAFVANELREFGPDEVVEGSRRKGCRRKSYGAAAQTGPIAVRDEWGRSVQDAARRPGAPRPTGGMHACGHDGHPPCARCREVASKGRRFDGIDSVCMTSRE